MSYSRPEPFVPGEISRVAFTLPDVCHRFRPGHRIMVQIQSSWFPLVDRNPQTYVNIHEATERDFVRTEHRVYHSPRFPSKLNVNFWRPPAAGAQ
jgi:predicted acyl esterase